MIEAVVDRTGNFPPLTNDIAFGGYLHKLNMGRNTLS